MDGSYTFESVFSFERVAYLPRLFNKKIVILVLVLSLLIPLTMHVYRHAVLSLGNYPQEVSVHFQDTSFSLGAPCVVNQGGDSQINFKLE